MSTEEALAWIADLFEEDPQNIEPETQRAEIPAWDSLGVLTLMAGLDEEFGILLTDEEMQEMECVKDLLDVLSRHGKLQ